MQPGDCINIPPEVKHWHGAASDEWFSQYPDLWEIPAGHRSAMK